MFNIEIYKKKAFVFFFGLVEGMVFFYCLSSCHIYIFFIFIRIDCFLQVFDCRYVTTTSGMFEAICNHIKYATNKGNLR